MMDIRDSGVGVWTITMNTGNNVVDVRNITATLGIGRRCASCKFGLEAES